MNTCHTSLTIVSDFKNGHHLPGSIKIRAMDEATISRVTAELEIIDRLARPWRSQ
jgi:hypothetical protein